MPTFVHAFESAEGEFVKYEDIEKAIAEERKEERAAIADVLREEADILDDDHEYSGHIVHWLAVATQVEKGRRAVLGDEALDEVVRIYRGSVKYYDIARESGIERGEVGGAK